jgi:hypothetical protein
MIYGHHGMTLDPLFSFEGKEQSAVQINLSVEWGRNGRRVLLDITHPIVQDLVAQKDHRLFSFVAELAKFGSREIEDALKREDDGNVRDEPTEEIPKITSGYIYLLKSGDGCYKIGRSKNVKSRMKAFNTQAPHSPELLHVIPSKDMYRSEEELHQRYAHCHVRGEWFALAEEEVRAICGIVEL